MFVQIAFLIAGVIGVAIIFIGARFLLAPQTAAAGYGAPFEPRETQSHSHGVYPWLYAKGVRDIASGLYIAILLAYRAPHPLGAFLLAASLIPIGDAAIVLRSGGTRAAAYGIHGVTAIVIAAAGVTLLAA